MNNNNIVQNVKTSSHRTDILPAWAAGEKLYGQRFFYHGMYISSLFNDEHQDPQPSTSKQKSIKSTVNSQVDIQTEISLPSPENLDLLTMLETFETNRKQFAFPDPGKSTQNVLNSLSVISSGIHNLFPKGVIVNKLSSSMSESDNIYLILGLFSLLCKLDLALEKQIVYSIKKLNCNIVLPGKTLDVIHSLIKETFMKHNLSKLGSTSNLQDTRGTSNQTATKVALNVGEPSNQKSVASNSMNAGKPSNQNDDDDNLVQNLGETINAKNKMWRTNKIQKKYFLNQHQMEFIDEGRYVCYGCAGIFTTDPSCHIINPTHIKANYKPAPQKLGL